MVLLLEEPFKLSKKASECTDPMLGSCISAGPSPSCCRESILDLFCSLSAGTPLTAACFCLVPGPGGLLRHLRFIKLFHCFRCFSCQKHAVQVAENSCREFPASIMPLLTAEALISFSAVPGDAPVPSHLLRQRGCVDISTTGRSLLACSAAGTSAPSPSGQLSTLSAVLLSTAGTRTAPGMLGCTSQTTFRLHEP